MQPRRLGTWRCSLAAGRKVRCCTTLACVPSCHVGCVTSYASRAGAVFDAVDLYNSATGTWSTAQLSVARSRLAAASVGNMALFAGGGLHAPNEVPWRGTLLRVWGACGKGRFRMAYKRLQSPPLFHFPAHQLSSLAHGRSQAQTPSTFTALQQSQHPRSLYRSRIFFLAFSKVCYSHLAPPQHLPMRNSSSMHHWHVSHAPDLRPGRRHRMGSGVSFIRCCSCLRLHAAVRVCPSSIARRVPVKLCCCASTAPPPGQRPSTRQLHVFKRAGRRVPNPPTSQPFYCIQLILFFSYRSIVDSMRTRFSRHSDILDPLLQSLKLLSLLSPPAPPHLLHALCQASQALRQSISLHHSLLLALAAREGPVTSLSPSPVDDPVLLALRGSGAMAELFAARVAAAEVAAALFHSQGVRSR